jgi:hypothetical protein
MARRTGVSSLRLTTYRLCRLLSKFTVVIHRVFPDETDLHTALDVAALACAVLLAELEGVTDYGD